ncbi:tetratricopeptide repeat protein [uncultured Roseivirga sp.]|uniref:tetratricopeptide repeat protein n=1 Tax=uncultured Roseivirga sp. TaxID=543088 RepID=UPI000D7B067D|nr:tetratricopeptide repeat protein [uncultured Roseivirga sp.]PWL30649.1 MAG: hypothetical protein DCO95_04010 [Roseivirga sp. XM-24bin3]
MAYIFNSKIENPERLERMLVARRPLVDLLEKRANALIDKGTLSQTLLIGPRGSGKTHMLKVFFNRVWNNPKREEKIVVAYMVEDEYGIDTFLDFLIRIFNAFMRWYENDETKQLAEEIEKLKHTNPDQRESYAIDILNKYLNGRDLLIIVENLNDIFKGLDKEGQARLRDYIQQYNNTAIFASSQALFSDIQQEDKPFQNFFNITHLKKLSYEEAMLLVNALAEEEKLEDFKAFLDTPRGKANVHAVFDLTQGNHRLLVTFFDFLKAEFKSDLAEAFLHTIDKLKPYYESYFKLLSPQQQKIVQYLSSKRKPVTGKDISLNSFIPHTTVSKQMSELQKLGYVESTKVGKEAFYEIAEPMLRLAFEVNENKKGIISIFIEFLTQLYEVEEIARRYLTFKYLSTSTLQGKDTYYREADFYMLAIPNYLLSQMVEYESRLLSIKDKSKAFEYIDSLAIKTNNIDEFSKHIYSLTDNDQWKEALEKTNDEHQRNIEQYRYFGLKGYILIGMKNYSAAVKELNNYIHENPNNAGVWHNLAVAYDGTGNTNKAVDCYKRELELDATSSNSWFNLAFIYDKKKDYAAAKRAYENAIEHRPNFSEAWFNLCTLLFENNRMEEYKELLIQALAKSENTQELKIAQVNHILKIESLELLDFLMIHLEKNWHENDEDRLTLQILVSKLFHHSSLQFISKILNRFYEFSKKEPKLLYFFDTAMSAGICTCFINHHSLNETRFTELVNVIEENYNDSVLKEFWKKFISIGVDYFYKQDSQALLRFTKEERGLFKQLVLDRIRLE